MPKTAFVPDDYVSVKERVDKFWTEYPEGSIRTKLIEERNGEALTGWICKAKVYRRDADKGGGLLLAATGYARQELLTSAPLKRDGKPNEFAPEWTSPVEVVETSAIGRALANMGYQTKGRPSQEEMSKAHAKAEQPPQDSVLHDGTYAYAVERLGDNATDIFVPALSRAGIKAGDWITTEDQAKQVREEIDAAAG